MKNSFTAILLLCLFQVSSAQYRTYESTHNEINQALTQTSDRGFLIAALEFCYTPEEWVIEGCPVGIHLIKTNADGDTLWTSEISNFDVQGYLHVFENRDGSFTLFAAQDSVFTCHEWVIDPSVGLHQLVIYQISSTGELVSQSSISDDCHLQLVTALPVTDSSYVVLARYSEPFASDTVEGRLYIMDKSGMVIISLVFPGEVMQKADVMIDTQGQILLFYVDRDSVTRLQQYDANLNLLQAHFNSSVNSVCLDAEDTRTSAVLSDSGNVFVVCDNPYNKGENFELLVFDLNLQLVGQKQYTLPLAADFVITDEQALMVLSQASTEEDSFDIRLTYFNASADSLLARQFRIPGNQAPNAAIALEGENFAITGGHNCCNLKASEGPGKTFLYLGEQSTAWPVLSAPSASITLYPNPASDYISIAITERESESVRYTLTIYSVLGESVYTGEVSSHAMIPIAELHEGFYFLSIMSANGDAGHSSFFKKIRE